MVFGGGYQTLMTRSLCHFAMSQTRYSKSLMRVPIAIPGTDQNGNMVNCNLPRRRVPEALAACSLGYCFNENGTGFVSSDAWRLPVA
jgi:hypothetical protein